MTLAIEYYERVHAAVTRGLAAEPEAQLTGPIASLLESLATDAGLGALVLLREAQLAGVRPDFAAFVNGHMCGWVELKAPGHTLDGTAWKGREKTQWELLSNLDALLVTDGTRLRLYQQGEPFCGVDGIPVEANLPYGAPNSWDPSQAVDLLRRFVTSRPRPVTRVRELSQRLAPLTAMLRDKVKHVITDAPGASEAQRQAARNALAAWRRIVHDGVDKAQFADDVAQVVAYSLAIVGLRGEGDIDGDGVVSLAEARQALGASYGTLSATLAPVLEAPGFLNLIGPEVGAIEKLVSQIDTAAISRSKDSRGEAWLWFYEDFLGRYDPEARKRAGVYYTPTQVVGCQVRLVQTILTTLVGDKDPLTGGRKGRAGGFANSSVITLDPATGSGTYPLAIIDHAVAEEVRRIGPGGAVPAAGQLEKNLIAFELLPGPFAVASLRIGARLSELQGAVLAHPTTRIYLTDTLDDPQAGQHPEEGLIGAQAVLAEQRQHTARIKSDEPITVVIGNPPYGRVDQEAAGGWVVHGKADTGAAEPRPLFDDVIRPAKDAGVIFSAQASLYDLYVYFWRWALWKAMQQSGSRPAVVSYITASTWIRGEGFLGLRQMARMLGDEIWVIDLGGDNRGTNEDDDDNVFAIETPVAIVIVYRAGESRPTIPADVYYRRITGKRAAKLDALEKVDTPHAQSDQWIRVPSRGMGDVFVPETGDALWKAFPRLTDLFPWQAPGTMVNRAWPISPSKDTLTNRWGELMAKREESERAELFVTPPTGRNVTTQVKGLRVLADEPTGARHRALVRYGYRCFDRQWTFADARLMALDRPALWQARSEKQLFLATLNTTPLGSGQALAVSADVPDKHFFCNRGGKDVIPLYRDADSQQPNITAGVLEALGLRLGILVTPEDLAAYVYAILAHPTFQKTFAEGLKTPGVRVPLTSDLHLWAEAISIGQDLLWAHTYGERFANSLRPSGNVPRLSDVTWTRVPSSIPATKTDIAHDATSATLAVGDGILTGVTREVWDYAVSGFLVTKQWFGQRTAKGIGRAASGRATPLDRIRPTVWEPDWTTEALELITVLRRTIDSEPAQADLLSRILDGPLIEASDLPTPTKDEQTTPKTGEPWYLDRAPRLPEC